jgi:hypothetical protein
MDFSKGVVRRIRPNGDHGCSVNVRNRHGFGGLPTPDRVELLEPIREFLAPNCLVRSLADNAQRSMYRAIRSGTTAKLTHRDCRRLGLASHWSS